MKRLLAYKKQFSFILVGIFILIPAVFSHAQTVQDLNNKISQNNQNIAQLEQEIALLAQLEHANIVRYLGTELNAMTSELSIFLEYMPGGSIADLVRNQHLCTPVALMATARLISSIAAQARVRVCRGFCHHCTITIESRLRATLSHLPGGHLAEHLPGGHLAENCFLKQLGPSRSKCRCVCSLNRESTDPEPATRAIH